MKTAIYCRVSTRKQTNDNQELILVEYAKRSGWDYELFTEQESTRGTRPIKQELLRRLRNKEFDTLCVLKLDRWGRSATELAMEIKELYEKGVSFVSLRDNIDLSTATGKLQFAMIAAFAEFERDLIRERTLDGLARAKSEGKVLGRKKGSKDSYPRKRTGYWLRHTSKKTRDKYQGGIIEEIPHTPEGANIRPIIAAVEKKVG
jgi:putative DNA-invertase from lambdoid prophage Rac